MNRFRAAGPWANATGEKSCFMRGKLLARRGRPSGAKPDGPDSGREEVGYAKCEDLKSISDRRLVHQIGAVDPAAVAAIERILRYLLDL
jgi:mRNA-degrading endonuclease toxin of MazEF toxin-antitoxin module